MIIRTAGLGDDVNPSATDLSNPNSPGFSQARTSYCLGPPSFPTQRIDLCGGVPGYAAIVRNAWQAIAQDPGNAGMLPTIQLEAANDIAWAQYLEATNLYVNQPAPAGTYQPYSPGGPTPPTLPTIPTPQPVAATPAPQSTTPPSWAGTAPPVQMPSQPPAQLPITTPPGSVIIQGPVQGTTTPPTNTDTAPTWIPSALVAPLQSVETSTGLSGTTLLIIAAAGIGLFFYFGRGK